jgi:hypothetical protein
LNQVASNLSEIRPSVDQPKASTIDQTNDRILNNFVFDQTHEQGVPLGTNEEEEHQSEDNDIVAMKAKFN